MASTYLTRAFSSNTSSTKCTWSFWVKFSAVNTGSNGSMLFQARNANNSNAYRTFIRYEDNATLDFLVYNGSGSLVGEYYTKRKFRDCNSWFHICYSIDTTLSTASDRLKLYVNGVRETEFDTSNYTELPQNEAVKTTSSVFTDISRNGGSAGYYFNGILSHYILTDGYVYQADTFGSTDSTTGEWKINPSPTISNWGSNGFWILKDGNSVTDSSPNSNNFTVGGGTLTKTEDCPSNVFATLNPLYLSASKFNFIQGNLRSNGWSSGTSQTWRSIYGTLGASSGKYYFEMKCDNMYSGDTGNIALGIVSDDQVVQTADNSKFFNGSTAYAYAGNGQKLNNDDSIAGGDSYGSSFTTNDIISCAYDLDNGKIYWAKNGTWANSGDPTSGSTGTGSAFNLTANLTYLPAVANYYDDDRWSFNFGNGYFGATAVSSAGTNASNNGIFEYDVPTGYTALSTKGLNL